MLATPAERRSSESPAELFVIVTSSVFSVRMSDASTGNSTTFAISSAVREPASATEATSVPLNFATNGSE